MRPTLTCYFGTMTGNAEHLAERAAARAKRERWDVQVRTLATVNPGELGAGSLALFFVSTWGDGEPPADACDFFYDLMKRADLRLSDMRYAVFGLGDSDYPEFNACARHLDERLAELGAQRFLERAEADVDFEATYDVWEDRVFAALNPEGVHPTGATL